MVQILSFNSRTIDIELKKHSALSSKRNLSQALKIQLIKEIVKKTLIELAVSLIFVGAACLFVATPLGMATLLACAATAVALNILFRSLAGFCHYRLFQLKNAHTHAVLTKKNSFEAALRFLNYLVPMTFSSLTDAQTRELMVHEAGHAIASQVLIKNPQARIRIKPFEGAVTSYRLGTLTKVGEFLGRENVKLFIAASGPAFSVLTAVAGFSTALAIRKSKPELSRYLKVIAIDSIAQHAFYALSALWTSSAQMGHDFVRLMAGGVHPVAATISMLALPIIVRIGFFIYDKIKETRQIKVLGENSCFLKNHRIQIIDRQSFKNAIQAA